MTFGDTRPMTDNEDQQLNSTASREPLRITVDIPRVQDISLTVEPRLNLRFSRSLTPFEASWLLEQADPAFEGIEHEEGAVWSIPVQTLLPMGGDPVTPQLAGYQLSVMAEAIEEKGADHEKVAFEAVGTLQGFIAEVNGFLASTPRSKPFPSA